MTQPHFKEAIAFNSTALKLVGINERISSHTEEEKI